MAKKQKNVVAAEKPATGTTQADSTLLWNERGQIGCTLPGHAPHRGSDTWKFERWKKVPPGATREDGTAYGCEVCGQADRASAASAPEAEPHPVETTSDAQDAGTADGAPAKRKGRKAKVDLTLADLAERYVGHLEASGKSAGTGASYALELKTALAALGADQRLADLKPEQVLGYFSSDRVLRKRNGKHKSPLSIAKTQRVLRQALVWAEEKGWVEKAPLPETLATH